MCSALVLAERAVVNLDNAVGGEEARPIHQRAGQ
jgi:hypothetical protein